METQETQESENEDNGKATMPVEEQEASEPSKPSKPEDRTSKILKRGRRLYQLFKKAGFTRDSFIELGESVKADKSFQELHPVVAKLILKIAAKQIDDETK